MIPRYCYPTNIRELKRRSVTCCRYFQTVEVVLLELSVRHFDERGFRIDPDDVLDVLVHRGNYKLRRVSAEVNHKRQLVFRFYAQVLTSTKSVATSGVVKFVLSICYVIFDLPFTCYYMETLNNAVRSPPSRTRVSVTN